MISAPDSVPNWRRVGGTDLDKMLREFSQGFHKIEYENFMCRANVLNAKCVIRVRKAK